VTPLTPAAAILLVGGLANLAFSTLAGFMLYWIRLRDVSVAQPRYAAVTWRANGERFKRVESVPWDRLGPGAHRELRVMLRYATSGDEAGVPASHWRASISAALSFFVWPARRWR